jgi:hypothetical protein
MYGHEARRMEVGARGGPLGAEATRRSWEEAPARDEEVSLVCTLCAADGRVLGTLTVELGPLDGYGGDDRAALLRQGAVMLAEAIQTNAASAPGTGPGWEDGGKAFRATELSIRAVLVADGAVLEEREFRLPAHGTQVIPSPRLPLSELVASYERRLIEDALRTTFGNRARAARVLQTTERILGYRIQQYGIDCGQYRRERG